MSSRLVPHAWLWLPFTVSTSIDCAAPEHSRDAESGQTQTGTMATELPGTDSTGTTLGTGSSSATVGTTMADEGSTSQNTQQDTQQDTDLDSDTTTGDDEICRAIDLAISFDPRISDVRRAQRLAADIGVFVDRLHTRLQLVDPAGTVQPRLRVWVPRVASSICVPTCSSGSTRCGSEECKDLFDLEQPCSFEYGAGMRQSGSGTECGLPEHSAFISYEGQDPQRDQLSCLLERSGDDVTAVKAMWPLLHSLGPRFVNTCNAGMGQDDALRVGLIVTERDYDRPRRTQDASGVSSQLWADAWQVLATSNARPAIVAGLLSDVDRPQAQCESQDDGPESSPLLFGMFDALGPERSHTASICQSDLAEFWHHLSDMVVQACEGPADHAGESPMPTEVGSIDTGSRRTRKDEEDAMINSNPALVPVSDFLALDRGEPAGDRFTVGEIEADGFLVFHQCHEGLGGCERVPSKLAIFGESTETRLVDRIEHDAYAVAGQADFPHDDDVWIASRSSGHELPEGQTPTNWVAWVDHAMASDSIKALVTDGSGRVYAAGRWQGRRVIDGATQLTADTWWRAYDARGNLLWAHEELPEEPTDEVLDSIDALAVSGDGQLYAAGRCWVAGITRCLAAFTSDGRFERVMPLPRDFQWLVERDITIDVSGAGNLLLTAMQDNATDGAGEQMFRWLEIDGQGRELWRFERAWSPSAEDFDDLGNPLERCPAVGVYGPDGRRFLGACTAAMGNAGGTDAWLAIIDGNPAVPDRFFRWDDRLYDSVQQIETSSDGKVQVLIGTWQRTGPKQGFYQVLAQWIF